MLFLFRRRKKEDEIIEGVEKENVYGTMSPKGGVGKTSITVEVAFLIAQRDYKVALVDWDLWSPRLTSRLLGAAEGPGLLELLMGEAAPDEVVRKVSFTTSEGKVIEVDLVPALDKNALMRGEVKRFAKELEEKYQKIKERAINLSNYLANTHDIVFKMTTLCPAAPPPPPSTK